MVVVIITITRIYAIVDIIINIKKTIFFLDWMIQTLCLFDIVSQQITINLFNTTSQIVFLAFITIALRATCPLIPLSFSKNNDNYFNLSIFLKFQQTTLYVDSSNK